MLEWQDIEMQMLMEMDRRARVTLPAAERRAAWARDLQGSPHAGGAVRPRPAIARWLGDRLVGLGMRLGAGPSIAASPRPRQ